MHNEIFNLVRAAAICLLILAVVVLCITDESRASIETPETTATAPTETTETEPATETTTPETEPTSATEAPTEPTSRETEPPTTLDPTGEWINLGTYKLTAYCACKKCCGKDPGSPGYGITATGEKAVAGTTIAVDPRIIPYGSKVKINNHTYIAQDTGGAIKENRIDIYFDDHKEALIFGVQYAEAFLFATN